MNIQIVNAKVTVILVRSVSDTLQAQVENKLFANLQDEMAEIADLVNPPLIFESQKACSAYLEGLSSAERRLAFVLIAHSKYSSVKTPPRFWPFAPGFTVSDNLVARTLSAIPFVEQGIYMSGAVLHASDTRRQGLAHNVRIWIERRSKAIQDGLITSETGWSWSGSGGIAEYPWGLTRNKQRRVETRAMKGIHANNGAPTSSSGRRRGWLGLKSEKQFPLVFSDRGDIHPHDVYGG